MKLLARAAFRQETQLQVLKQDTLGSLLGTQRPPGNDVQGRSGMENSGRAEEGQPLFARHFDVMSVCSSAQHLGL